MVKGARDGELVVCGALTVCLNSQRPLMALLLLRSHFPCFSPVKIAVSQTNGHVERHGVPLPAGLCLPDGSLDSSGIGTEV